MTALAERKLDFNRPGDLQTAIETSWKHAVDDGDHIAAANLLDIAVRARKRNPHVLKVIKDIETNSKPIRAGTLVEWTEPPQWAHDCLEYVRHETEATMLLFGDFILSVSRVERPM